MSRFRVVTRNPGGFPKSVSDLDIGAPGILDDLASDDPVPPLVELVETRVRPHARMIQTAWMCCHGVVKNHPGVVSFTNGVELHHRGQKVSDPAPIVVFMNRITGVATGFIPDRSVNGFVSGDV